MSAAATQISETSALWGDGRLQAVERIAEGDGQPSNYGAAAEEAWKQPREVTTT
jgi:hypothetical protein